MSSPQVSNFSEQPARVEAAEVDGTAVHAEGASDDRAGPSSGPEGTAAASSPQKQGDGGEAGGNDATKAGDGDDQTGRVENVSEADEAFAEETLAPGQEEDSQPLGNESKFKVSLKLRFQ